MSDITMHRLPPMGGGQVDGLCDCDGGGISLDLFRSPSRGHVGDTITYTVIVSNPSTNDECTISNVSATLTTPDGTVTTLPVPTTLVAGASSGPISVMYTIAPGDVVNDTVTAAAQASGTLNDCFCDSPTSAQSQVCAFVAMPDLTVTKAVTPALSKVGDTVQYTIQICNTGNITLNRTSVIDTVLGDITASFPATLAPGQCAAVMLPFVIPAGAPDPLVNTVTATYTDVIGDVHSTVTRTASASVDLFQPSLSITKSGPLFSKVGDTVAYTFTITNTSSQGSPPLELVSINDTLLGGLVAQATAGICTTLAPGATCTFTVPRVVQAGDPSPLVNTVTAIYRVQGFTNTVTASDTHSVTLVNPSFFLSKVCQNGIVPAGGTAVFEVTVTNNGNVPLNFTTTESAPFSLAPGATNTFTVSIPAPPLTPPNCTGEVSNTISVTATLPPEFGLSNTIQKSATATCEVVAFGRTRGFWGNQGHSILDPDGDGILNTPATIGGGPRTITVTTIAQSDQLLGPQGFCPTPASCTLSPGLNRGTLNTLIAQTLALQYNILFLACYAGQTIGDLGCTPPPANLGLGLTSSSTVEQVLAVANQLIAGSTSAGTTTQQQAGAMNSLLGCLNRES